MFNHNDILELGRNVVLREAETLAALAEKMDEPFVLAVKRIRDLRGAVVVAGMGKAGIVGQKIVATLASTGTQSHFLHPAEAIHGDLGRIGKSDAVLMLSQSGETEEIVRILPTLQEMGIPIIALTASAWSTLGRAAEIILPLGTLEEADEHNLAPSTSTTAMLALGDALALTVSRLRGFGSEDFARFHPGGALGRKLSLAVDTMRPLSACRTAPETETVREIFIKHSIPGRRSGAVLLLDPQGRLAGIFTDSDLARLFERRSEHLLDAPISQVMTHSPTTVDDRARTMEAVALMIERKISELPVIDAQGRPRGVIDITDVIAFLPKTPPWNDQADVDGSTATTLEFGTPEAA